MDFAILVDHRMKRKQNDRQVFGTCQRIEKVVEYKDDVDTNCSWCTWNSYQRLEEKNWKNEKLEKDYSIVYNSA